MVKTNREKIKNESEENDWKEKKIRGKIGKWEKKE